MVDLSRLIFHLSSFLFLCLPALISVAFFTLLERKLLRLVGTRLGPFKVSFLGILQPIGDAVKLSNKRVNSLRSFSLFFYYISSFLMIMSSLLVFLCLNFSPSPAELKFSLLFLLLILGFNSLNSILAGWRAYRKFSLIGRVRTVSQLISYEAVLYMCIFFIILCFRSFSLTSYGFFQVPLAFLVFLPCFFIWIPSMLAELNRTPYDFSEGERELVRGFNTEFGSGCFTLIFLAEYGSIVFFCMVTSFLFFFPSIFPLFFFFFFFLIWVRSVLPRFRFDKLMILAWKFLIPFISFFYCLFIVFFI